MNSEQEPEDSDYQKSGLIKIREEFEKRILLNVLEAVQVEPNRSSQNPQDQS